MRVILLDASGFLFRAFHAQPLLTRSDGLPIGAVHGYCSMLWRLLSEDWLRPNPATHIAACFDKGTITWRNEVYPGYKLDRPERHVDLKPQFPLVRRATKAFGLPVVELDGYEADDLIATYTEHALAAGAEGILIVSSDKDLMQLIRPKVFMMRPKWDPKIRKWDGYEIVGVPAVFKRFGVPPHKVCDVQALTGDSTDSVPGVMGVGEKTAAQLIEMFEDLDGVLANAHLIKKPIKNAANLRARIEQNRGQIRISRILVEMKRDVPVEQPLGDFKVSGIDRDVLFGFLREMEFESLAAQVLDALPGNSLMAS